MIIEILTKQQSIRGYAMFFRAMKSMAITLDHRFGSFYCDHSFCFGDRC